MYFDDFGFFDVDHGDAGGWPKRHECGFPIAAQRNSDGLDIFNRNPGNRKTDLFVDTYATQHQ